MLLHLIILITECSYPKFLLEPASYINQPRLPKLIQLFLFDQLNSDTEFDPMMVPLADHDCSQFKGHVHIYSAVAWFYAPSDLCGERTMHYELICSNPL